MFLVGLHIYILQDDTQFLQCQDIFYTLFVAVQLCQTFVFEILSSCIVFRICRKLSAHYRPVMGVSFLIGCVGYDRSAAVVKWAVLERDL